MDKPSTITGYYTIKEAAEVIGVSSSQVNRYIIDGTLKAIDLGKQWILEQSAVHNFQRPPRGNPTFRRAE